MGEGSSSVVLFNTIVVGKFQVKRSIYQGCPLAPLLFATFTHPLIAMLELMVEKKEICGFSLPNREQLLAKLFAYNYLLFLKAKPENLRKALQIMKLFCKSIRVTM